MDVKPQSSTAMRAEAGAPKEAARRPGNAREEWLGFFKFLAKLLLVVIVVRIAVIAPFSIPSQSMLPQLWKGDYLIASKWPYGYSRASLPLDLPLSDGRLFSALPKRGDVVVFKHPLDRRDYIKRVVGLPGDTVAMLGGRVVLNGQLINQEAQADLALPMDESALCTRGGTPSSNERGEPACLYRQSSERLPGEAQSGHNVLDLGLTQGDTITPQRVPAGHVFVMGDNRDNSRDSRFAAMKGDAVGMVPVENLVGRAEFIIWSSDGSAHPAKPWTWFSAARWGRIGKAL